MEPERVREVVAANIRRYIALRNFTIPTLADAAGISRGAFYRVMRCEASVTVDTLAKVATALAVDVHKLLVERARPS